MSGDECELLVKRLFRGGVPGGRLCCLLLLRQVEKRRVHNAASG